MVNIQVAVILYMYMYVNNIQVAVILYMYMYVTHDIMQKALSVSGTLNEKFHSYDIIKTHHVRVHSLSRRSIQENFYTKEINLAAFGRYIGICMFPNKKS